MNQLHFEEHLTKRWQESKREFRARFWEEIQQQLRGQVKQIMEDLIQTEFNSIIGAQPYERNHSRKSKRNGSYTRNLETPLGRIQDIEIPRARQLDIRFSLFDRWQQVEDSVLESMLQAYLLGRSGSCAQKIIQGFNHSSFSRSFLQRLTHRFEDNLQAWLNRPITTAWPYLFIDGMVVDVKEAHLQQWCVLWALGMDEKRNIEVLGFVILKTESQEGSERLLRDLKGRGLKPPRLIISDDSKAIENAAAMVFPHTPQQGCVFHKVKATGRHLKNTKNRKSFLRQARDIYAKAKTKRAAIQRLQNFKKRWRKKESKAVRSLQAGFDRTLAYFDFPQDHWSWIRTNNPSERFIREVRRWTLRLGYFQGRGNLYTALFTFLCHQNPKLVPNLNQNQSHDLKKDTILIA
ncbi:MAG: IS256 family transposase [Candidatus Omnitrophica bacterium]|nr:IS256 family transposase [Candidatus Omnitrophota bacterium]